MKNALVRSKMDESQQHYLYVESWATAQEMARNWDENALQSKGQQLIHANVNAPRQCRAELPGERRS